MSDESLRSTIYQNLNLKESEELLQIWHDNKRYEWSDTAFEVIQQILEERGLTLSPQEEAQIEPIIEENENDDSNEYEPDQNESQPIFYKPQELLFFASTTSKAAWIILGIGVLFTLLRYLWQLRLTSGGSFNLFSLGLGFLSMALSLASHALTFFMLKGISIGLNVLMEFEYNSRGVK
jgi:hypothetical protein